MEGGKEGKAAGPLFTALECAVPAPTRGNSGKAVGWDRSQGRKKFRGPPPRSLRDGVRPILGTPRCHRALLELLQHPQSLSRPSDPSPGGSPGLFPLRIPKERAPAGNEGLGAGQGREQRALAASCGPSGVQPLPAGTRPREPPLERPRLPGEPAANREKIPVPRTPPAAEPGVFSMTREELEPGVGLRAASPLEIPKTPRFEGRVIGKKQRWLCPSPTGGIRNPPAPASHPKQHSSPKPEQAGFQRENEQLQGELRAGI